MLCLSLRALRYSFVHLVHAASLHLLIYRCRLFISGTSHLDTLLVLTVADHAVMYLVSALAFECTLPHTYSKVGCLVYFLCPRQFLHIPFGLGWRFLRFYTNTVLQAPPSAQIVLPTIFLH